MIIFASEGLIPYYEMDLRYLYWSQAQQLRLGNVNNFCSQPPSEFFCVLKCDQTVAIIESYTMISISMEFRRKEK